METLVAHSKQPLWQVYVLVPATALLLYMTRESFNPSFADHSSSAVLNVVDPTVRAWFFGICAAICIACIGLVCWRRASPRIELMVDAQGVTSKLFWGPGTIAWADMNKLVTQANWLFVHGTDKSGRQKKLVVNLGELDVDKDAILKAIFVRRPDLFHY